MRRRLRTQRLTGAGFARPEDVVGWLGAVQAQDYGPAKWSVGRRAGRATDAAVEHAFAAGSDPAHARAATDLALRAAGRHPLAAHGDRAARPGAQRLPVSSSSVWTATR